MTLVKERLEDLGQEVRRLGIAEVATASGVRKARVSRFVNDPMALSMHDVQRVERAVAALRVQTPADGV